MPAGVSVDGESLEGLTEAEAEEQVQSRVDEKLAREVALTIGGNVLCGQLRRSGHRLEKMRTR